MEPVMVRCTRESFARCARQRCADSPWELRSKFDALGTSVEWLEATYTVCSSVEGNTSQVLTTVCVFFNPDFSVPQLGFYTSTLTSLEDLQMMVPNLTFVNAPATMPAVDGTRTSHRPLASFSWCQELGQHMWLVHPCDTENVLRCRRYDGEQGDVLSVFLRAMSDYFPLLPLLLPHTEGNEDIGRV